jgi:hypothetical protein
MGAKAYFKAQLKKKGGGMECDKKHFFKSNKENFWYCKVGRRK